MASTSKENTTNPEGLSLDVVTVTKDAKWSEAFEKLKSGDAKEFLRRTAAAELYDYSPLDKQLKKLTDAVHKQMTSKPVAVIPRGSFVSRTALTKTADLDVDLLIPEEYKLEITDSKTKKTETKTIKEWLGVNEDVGTILFDKDKLVKTLGGVWDKLKGEVDGWLELKDKSKAFTRSIPAQTKDKVKYIGDRKLEIDLFIKVLSRRGPYEYIVGVDKDGPDQLRRITTTEYIPTEGKWIGDRTLQPAERMAIIMLKWWKEDKGIKIKSHHLLSALNALQDLNEKDSLWLPINVSTPYSNLRVMEIMRGILIYLDWTYNENPCGFMLKRKNADDKEIMDYPFPEQSRTIQDKLFIQYNQDQNGDTVSIKKVKDNMKDIKKELDGAVKKLREKK